MTTATKQGRGSRGGGRGKAKKPAQPGTYGALDPEAIAGNGASGHSARPSPPAPIPSRSAEIVEAANLALDSIRPSPYQPRQSFPEAEIAELAESMRTLGQRVPIAVRRASDAAGGVRTWYELLDGERRWRAAKVAGLKSLRAEIQEASDAKARAIVLLGTDHGKPLNAIEQAAAYQAILESGDAGDVSTPEARSEAITRMAERIVQKPRSSVANKLRLLDLPEAMQREVISAEMPEWIARSLAKYAEVPDLLDAIHQEIDTRRADEWSEITKPEHLTDLCVDVVRDATRPIEGHADRYDHRFSSKPHNGYPPVFEPDEAQRAKLGIVEVPAADGRETATRRATNVKLWDQLQKAHVEKLIQQREARGKKGRGGDGETGRGKKAAGEPTAAEQKAAAEAEKRKAAEARAALKRRVSEIRTDWLRYLIAGLVADQTRTSVEDLVRLLLMLGQRWNLNHYAQHAVLDDVRRLLGAGGQWKSVAGRDDSAMLDAATAVCARLFWDGKQDIPARPVPADDVEAIAATFRIDAAAAWAREKLGPLTEEYFHARTKDQLASLAKELKIELPAGGKAEQVAHLAAAAKLPMPRELK